MQSSSKKIVEICGLPGVGKTTIARKLTLDTNIDRVILTKKSRIVTNYCLGFIVRPKTFVYGLYFAMKHADSWFNFWNNHVYRYARYSSALRSKLPICILDEGPHQSIFSYAIDGLTEKEFKHYVEHTPKADLTILLTVSEEKRQQNLNKRRIQQPENINRREMHDNLKSAQAFLSTYFVQMPCAQIVHTSEEAERLIRQCSV